MSQDGHTKKSQMHIRSHAGPVWDISEFIYVFIFFTNLHDLPVREVLIFLIEAHNHIYLYNYAFPNKIIKNMHKKIISMTEIPHIYSEVVYNYIKCKAEQAMR